MFEVGLLLQLRHREIHGNLPLLFANLENLQELFKSYRAPRKKRLRMYQEDYKNVQIERISEILFWIAKHHPEVLKNESKLLCNISIDNLCLRDSYERIDTLIPMEPLITLLNSKVCSKLDNFCGYVHPRVLDYFEYLASIKLALGKHNIDFFIENPSYMDKLYCSHEDVTIHLLCGELSHEKIASLPDMNDYDNKIVYISDVSDQDVDWVLQVLAVLNPDTLNLKGSTLTAAGVQAIAKGLCNKHINVVELGVYSPHINEDVDIPGYDDSDDFLNTISQMYRMNCYCFTHMKEWLLDPNVILEVRIQPRISPCAGHTKH